MLSGLVLSAVSMTIGLAVVPSYIHYLGIEAYGLIGFFLALQGVLQVLDLGLAPTANREIARLTTLLQMASARDFLRTLDGVYWVVALLIGFGIALAAPMIADSWLQAQHLSAATVARAIMLMGVTVAVRWPTGLYTGVLSGAGRLTQANTATLTTALAGSVGAVAVLAFISPTIEAFFLWQTSIGFAQALLMRYLAWRALPGDRPARFNWGVLGSVWRFSVGMSGIALSAIIFGQLDKIILSRTVSLREFGYYALATTVASALYRLVNPIFSAIYPRFSVMVARDDRVALEGLYRVATNLFSCLFFPAAMLLAVCASPIMLLWTHDVAVASAVTPLVTILAVGSAIHGVMYFPYALQLAEGNARLPVTINLILLVVMVPLIVGLSLRLGVRGGAIGWLVLHSLYLPLGTWLTHRKYLVGMGSLWLMRDVGVPAIVATLCGLMARATISSVNVSSLVQIGLGCGFAALAASISYLFSPFDRHQAQAMLAA